MNENIYIKPAPGMVVRDPADGKPLPETGKTVPNTTHWQRRLKDQDVVLAKPPKQEKGGK
jgi:hypothetical protein